MTEPVQYPAQVPPSARKSNGLGITALVLGVVAIIVSFVPIVSVAGVVLGVIALILGIVGLVLKGLARGTAIAGVVLGALSIVIGSIVMAVTAAFVVHVGSVIETASAELEAEHSVVYEVSGTGATASISYEAWEGDTSTTISNNEQALPFSVNVTAPGGFVLYSVSASQSVEGGELSCKLTVDGKVVQEDKATGGSFQIVSCIGSWAS